MKRGKVVCRIVSLIMPCFIKKLNPIVHKYKTEKYNLQGNQIKVLNGVKILKKVSPAELSRILMMQKGSLTTIIKSLVDMKLLTKNFNITDTRRYTLSITAKGKLLLQDKMCADEVKFAAIFAEMPQEDFTRVVEGFEVLIKYLQDDQVAKYEN